MAEVLKSVPEGRVTLRNVGWETYERLVEEDPGRSAPRFFYDRGELEIVSPSFEHEQITRVISSLIEELSVELDVDMISAGSTTFKREGAARGFEPDACFYFPEKSRRFVGSAGYTSTPETRLRTSSWRWDHESLREQAPHLRPFGSSRGVAPRRRTTDFGTAGLDAPGTRVVTGAAPKLIA